MLESRHKVGGLASSERSPNGFTYDIGGHVLFSHYEYFDRLFDRLMGDEYQELLRESWVWMFDRFLPYPFQNNIKYLPKEVVLECLLGLIEAQKQPLDKSRFNNFDELIHGVFGAGIVRHFMMPYNFKVWAHPPCMMNKEWIGERVSTPPIERVLGNVVLDREDVSWGPNATFKYPRVGGTGELFERMRPYVDENLRLCAPVVSVDVEHRDVVLADGSREPFDVLLSTMPLDILVKSLAGPVPDCVRTQAARLRHSGSCIVGVGIRQPSPSTKCWMYFPEDNAPFYRLTYLSNYSPDVVPDPSTHYSILAEISHSEFKPVDRKTIVDDTIQGLVNTRMISEEDRRDIVDAHLDRTRLHVSHAVSRARRSAEDRSAMAGSTRHTRARSLRSVAIRGRQHGPRRRTGRRVGEPSAARRFKQRAHLAGQARMLTSRLTRAARLERSTRIA